MTMTMSGVVVWRDDGPLRPPCYARRATRIVANLIMNDRLLTLNLKASQLFMAGRHYELQSSAGKIYGNL